MSPFDTQVYHEHQICLRFHRILKVILEMAFSAHCTPIWKVNRISTTIINKVTRKCIWCCHRVQRCVTSPGFGVKLCSGAWKRGPDSHVGTSSLCQARTTKFGQKNQNTLVKVFIVLGVDWPWPLRWNLTGKSKFCIIICLFTRVDTQPPQLIHDPRAAST